MALLDHRDHQRNLVMPKRSNDFQKLVFLARKALADGAVVTESKMMRHRLTKTAREVDVVVEGVVAGCRVFVSIECRDHARVADVTWVEQMITKHQYLATNALILASKSAFTPDARKLAECRGVETVEYEEQESLNLEPILGPSGALWLKTIEITPGSVAVFIDRGGDPLSHHVKVTPAFEVHTEAAGCVTTFEELIPRMLQSTHTRDSLLAEADITHTHFVLEWRPPPIDGQPLCLQYTDPLELHRIEMVQVSGSCKVEIGKFGLVPASIGDVKFAWGKSTLAGRGFMVVATEGANGRANLSVSIDGDPSVLNRR
jgi:hypothetical protein